MTLTLSGSVVTSGDTAFCQVRNLAGCFLSATEAIAVALSSIDRLYDAVYTHHASDVGDSWKNYNTAASPFVNGSTQIGRGWGCWIRVSQDCALSVQ